MLDNNIIQNYIKSQCLILDLQFALDITSSHYF